MIVIKKTGSPQITEILANSIGDSSSLSIDYTDMAYKI